MYSKRKYLGDAFIKRYSVPVGVIGLALTAMSTFGIKMDGTFEAYKFWAAIWFFIALIILFIIALDLSIKELNQFANSKFNIGELPPVLSINSVKNGDYAKIILHPKENISLQKDAVVSIILSDDIEGDLELGLGVITDLQADGKVALVATPKRDQTDKLEVILKDPARYTNKIRVRTIIDRNYVNDDYLYKENYEIGSLSGSVDGVTTDGKGTKL